MSSELTRPATQDALFVWVMHRFSEEFEGHAILKGGMVLRLLDSPRFTNDIDYVFTPSVSKKDVLTGIRQVLEGLDGAEVEIALHSKMLRADLSIDGTSIQIEVSVVSECESEAMATSGLALSAGQPSQVVRIMSLPHALAHKLAAWNERRLWRDLYDVYFLVTHSGASPALAVLDDRLANMDSRLPRLRKIKSISRSDFARDLRLAVQDLEDKDLAQELEGILAADERAGLALRLRTAISRLLASWE